MRRDFWAGRRVLVTGHTGFKGSWLSLWLAGLGANVTGYSRRVPGRGSMFALARVGELARSVEGDVRDHATLRSAISAHRPEVVFHLAGQPLVGASRRAPLDTYETNVMGTVGVLEAIRRSDGIHVALNVTTDKCYEPSERPGSYREGDPLGGDDPYTSSMACSELVTAAYRSSFFTGDGDLRLASARASNVIGGGDFAPDRIVPDAMRAALAGRELTVRNPLAVRPWQHVLGALSGYLLLAERLWNEPALAGAWNFGPGQRDARSVGWIADRLAALWGEGFGWTATREAGGERDGRRTRIDSSRARTLLGWSSPWQLDEGLERTVEWFRALAEGRDMRELTFAQIDDFVRAGEAAPAPGAAADPSSAPAARVTLRTGAAGGAGAGQRSGAPTGRHTSPSS